MPDSIGWVCSLYSLNRQPGPRCSPKNSGQPTFPEDNPLERRGSQASWLNLLFSRRGDHPTPERMGPRSNEELTLLVSGIELSQSRRKDCCRKEIAEVGAEKPDD